MIKIKVSPKMKKYLEKHPYMEPNGLQEQKSGDSKEIYILGDSNTTAHKDYWIKLAKRSFPGAKVNFLARGGSEIPRILGQLDEVEPKNTKMVVIGSLGGNDAKKLTNKDFKTLLEPGGEYYSQYIEPLMQKLHSLRKGGVSVKFFGLPFGRTSNPNREKARAAMDLALLIAAQDYGIDYETVFDRTRKIKGKKAGVHYQGDRRRQYRELLAVLVGDVGPASDKSEKPERKLGDKTPAGKIIGKSGKYDIIDTRTRYQKARELKQKPRKAPPKLIVIHTGTKAPGVTIGTFHNAGLSSNYEVGKDGSVYMFVPPDKYTIHAGYNAINSISLGVDIAQYEESAGPYPRDQVLSARELVQNLCRKYNIPDVVAPDIAFYDIFNKKYNDEQLGKAMAKYFIENGIGIIRHRNIRPKSCPDNFPVEQLGRMSKVDLVKLKTILGFDVGAPERTELSKDIFDKPKDDKTLVGTKLTGPLREVEPFQQAVKSKHKKMKIRLIGQGKGKNTRGTTKPSYKRSKSAPPGFGGSLEESN